MLQGKDFFILFSGKIYLAYSFCCSSVISWNNSMATNGKNPKPKQTQSMICTAESFCRLHFPGSWGRIEGFLKSHGCAVTLLSSCNFSRPLIQVLCCSLTEIHDFWASLKGLWVWVETQALAQALKQAGWPQWMHQGIQQKSCFDSCRIPISGIFLVQKRTGPDVKISLVSSGIWRSFSAVPEYNPPLGLVV